MKRVLLAVMLLSRLAAADEFHVSAAHASASHKPLVVELYAEWCGPCHLFESTVLKREDVQAKLADVELVRYDIDKGVGESVANEFHINDVPTFLVVDGNGKELLRERGLGADPAGQFIDLLHRARIGYDTATTLEAAIVAHPDDMSARLALAKRYRSDGRTVEARVHLLAVSQASDRSLAAEAVAQLDELDLADARVNEALDKATDFVTRFPDSPRAASQLVLLAQAHRMRRGDLRALVEKHLQTVSNDNLALAVRVAIVTANFELARAQLVERRQTAKRTHVLDVLSAELDLYSSTKFMPPTVCRDPDDAAFDCYLLEQAVATGSRLTAATSRLLRDAASQLEALERLQSTLETKRGIDALADEDPAYRDALAAALRKARHACATKVEVGGAFYVGALLGRQTGFDIGGTSELADCVRASLKTAALPPAPFEGTLITPLYFPALEHRPDAEIPRLPVGGVELDFLARLGAIESQSLALRGLWDFAGDRFVRPHIAGEVEVGVGASGASYAARGYIGLSVAVTPRSVSSISVGIGSSETVGQLARALEVPVELRERLAFGETRLHLWARSTQLFGAKSRDGSSNLLIDGDEFSLGVAMSLPLHAHRLLFGAAFEHRVAGSSGVLAFGIPFGGY